MAWKNLLILSIASHIYFSKQSSVLAYMPDFI